MTRREEIENNIGYKLTHAAMAYYRENCTKDLSMDEIFEDGADWRQEIMIEKARQWFNLHFIQVGAPREIKHDFESKEQMWKSFTQFMEE